MSTIPLVSDVGITPFGGSGGSNVGAGLMSMYLLATLVSPVARIVAVVPRRSGPKPESSETPTWARPFGVSEIESTVPAGVPPILTRSPVTSCPASTKSNR